MAGKRGRVVVGIGQSLGMKCNKGRRSMNLYAFMLGKVQTMDLSWENDRQTVNIHDDFATHEIILPAMSANATLPP